MNQDTINLVKHAIKEELTISTDGVIVIEELLNNELLSGLSKPTIDKIVHDLADTGAFELF